MESDRPDRDAAVPPAGAAEPARTEWRALTRLRDRVETAAREIERLRTENAALAHRVAELQDSGAPHPLLSDGEPPEALRARVEAFIASLDRVLAAPPDDDAPPAGDGAEAP
jgi:hypothetical protein